ncbi:hypothetical protein BDR04DRAFT_1117974 [Suillus decipiens]|nr:hypothetical protein BDR04DRAFT_1117974 [Suillus decipiens]
MERIVTTLVLNGEDLDVLQGRWKSAWLERIERHRGNIYNANHSPINVEDVDENNVSSSTLQDLIDLAQVTGTAIGVVATYRPDCTLSSLAFATLTKALVIHFFAAKEHNLQQQTKTKKGQEQRPLVFLGRTLIQNQISCNPGIQFYGYRIDRIALSLYETLSPVTGLAGGLATLL